MFFIQLLKKNKNNNEEELFHDFRVGRIRELKCSYQNEFTFIEVQFKKFQFVYLCSFGVKICS